MMVGKVWGKLLSALCTLSDVTVWYVQLSLFQIRLWSIKETCLTVIKLFKLDHPQCFLIRKHFQHSSSIRCSVIFGSIMNWSQLPFIFAYFRFIIHIYFAVIVSACVLERVCRLMNRELLSLTQSFCVQIG